MMRSRKTTDPKKPKHLTFDQMWELYRILKPAKSLRVINIIEQVHPLKIATVIEILYGSSDVVTSGIMLLDYLYTGLEYNHFDEFVRATRRA